MISEEIKVMVHPHMRDMALSLYRIFHLYNFYNNYYVSNAYFCLRQNGIVDGITYMIDSSTHLYFSHQDISQIHTTNSKKKKRR